MSAALKSDTINIIDAAATPALAKLFGQIGKLTTLPASAQRIMEAATDQSAGAGELLEVIEGDPVLAAKILRRVNSAFYGLRNRVEDLRSAISLMGPREIRNLAFTVYVSRMFDGESSHRDFSREGLWQHCVAVGQAARLVSATCRCEKPDEAYLAGLLHDMGLILLDQYLPKKLMRVVDAVADGAGTVEAEMSLLPFDHTQLGAYVAMQWNFPPAVIAAARYHHDPLFAPKAYRPITSIVAVANYLCHRADVTSLGVANIEAPSDDVLSEIQMDQAQLTTIWEQLREALESSPKM